MSSDFFKTHCNYIGNAMIGLWKNISLVSKGELWGNWVDGTVPTYSNWETGNWEFLPTSYINGYGYMWYGTNDNRWMFANVTLEGYNNIPGGETPTFICQKIMNS